MDKPAIEAVVAELIGKPGHTKVGALIRRLLDGRSGCRKRRHQFRASSF